MVGILSAAIGYMLGWETGPSMSRKVKFKRVSLPCPACRDEETGKPTGVISPSNPYLSEAADGATFECTTCRGTKRVIYEYPRGSDVDITDDGKLASPVGSTTEIRQIRENG